MRQKLIYFIAIIACGIVTGGQTGNAQEPAAEAAVPEAISEKGVNGELEAVYESWRTSVREKNFNGWKSVTTESRQIEVENEIVSQKLEFPEALFDVPISAPSLEKLLLLDVLTRRETAASIYFGKADFGVGDPSKIRDNIIVVNYLKEGGRWRFDKLRVVKIPPDVLGMLRLNDLSFLKGPEFQPPVGLPDLPQRVPRPDYIAEIWINSVGYESTVSVNGREVGVISNTKTQTLLIGGLRRGENNVTVKTRKLDEIDLGIPDRLQIAIYALIPNQEKPQRVFHFLPAAGEIPKEKRMMFGVSH